MLSLSGTRTRSNKSNRFTRRYNSPLDYEATEILFGRFLQVDRTTTTPEKKKGGDEENRGGEEEEEEEEEE